MDHDHGRTFTVNLNIDVRLGGPLVLEGLRLLRRIDHKLDAYKPATQMTPEDKAAFEAAAARLDSLAE